jgi:acyl-CoA hydrolase
MYHHNQHMQAQNPIIALDADYIVEEVIRQVGTTISLATPLAMGKANHVVNAFYRKAKAEPSIQLTILTALTLEIPKGQSLLEKRFLEPFVKRVFGDYPDLDYELDRIDNKLPSNIQVIEFYLPPGKFLHNAQVQQNYISSNYTHACRDLMDRGVNVIAQLISPHQTDMSKCSLSGNPDIALDLIEAMQQREQREEVPYAIVGQVNPNLPYMYGDAEVGTSNFHYILDRPEYYYRIFSTPKLSIPEREHMVGLYLSTLIRDEGELQVGIGAMGDAFVNALILRQKDNTNYRQILRELQVEEKFGDIIERVGDTRVFDKGLFGASEMVIDGFIDLYEAGILKRKVYDDLPIQRLLNEKLIGYEVTPSTLELLLQRKAVHMYLSREDFDYLVKFGILRDDMTYDNGIIRTSQGQQISADFTSEENKQQIMRFCLGDYLKGGAIVHGAFFLGPQDFYDRLKALPENERRLFNMRSVRRINHLYGHEEIDRLQRGNARFLNTCMKVTLSGSVISDGLEDNRVISGVGGQYNFVAMAHELPGGRSLINLRATREVGNRIESNIVWNYGHTTIPRHLRDIVVTEYGIADLRGKTDSEIIEELLKITDSRFQTQLMRQAKKSGKLRSNYRIPELFRNNYPNNVIQKIAAFRKQGFFPPYPFGTDLTEQEQVVGRALKSLRNKSRSRLLLTRALFRAILTFNIPQQHKPYLERMGLWQAKGIEERLYRKLLSNELKDLAAV